jgi:hypothetical protein
MLTIPYVTQHDHVISLHTERMKHFIRYLAHLNMNQTDLEYPKIMKLQKDIH